MEQRLAEIKVRSFIDISHELRTPLTLISGPVLRSVVPGAFDFPDPASSSIGAEKYQSYVIAH